MNIYIMSIVFVLLLFFLILGLLYQNTIFITFAAVCSIIIVFEVSNTGVEYPSGSTTTIEKINANQTIVTDTYEYQEAQTFWRNTILGIFALFALMLFWLAIVGFEEDG